MDRRTSRRNFLARTAPALGIAAAWGGGGAVALAQSGDKSASAGDMHDHFPQQDHEAVRDTVGVAHFDLDKLRKLVDRRPALVNATWDWGFGDWETALGAASHVGRPDIAEYLLGAGARMDIFAAAMLGHVDAVRGILAAQPALARNRGPHGIPLMAHAKAGGEKAAAVVEYLKSVSGCDEPEPGKTFTEQEGAAYLGAYRPSAGPEWTVKVAKLGMAIAIGEGSHMLRGTGDHVFHPAGAPAVNITFTIEGDKATAVEIRDARQVLRASRV